MQAARATPEPSDEPPADGTAPARRRHAKRRARTALGRKAASAVLRGYLIQALEGASRQMRAEGRLEESERLVAEARTLGASPASLQAPPAMVGPPGPRGPARP